MSKLKLSELARKVLENTEVAPRIKPSEPTTKPKRRNPLRVPRTAPKPAPKAEQEVIDDIVARLTKLNERKSKYSLMEMLNELNLDDIKKKFVGDRKGGPGGKVVTPKEFDEIMDVTKNKLALAVWMLKRIQDGFILPEDIYKWKNYFETFKRKKQSFPIKDLNQIKTEDDIDEFVNKALEIENPDKLEVSYELLNKYKDLHIGKVDGFEVFKIPQNDSGEGEDFYFKAACDLGEDTQWCTAGGRNWYSRYIKDGPLYVFINPTTGDKYQFHYESDQFMDKADRSILSRM